VIGFLHTAASHVDTFTRLVRDADAFVPLRHAVHPGLLAAARQVGADRNGVRPGVEQALRPLTEAGARVVVCTCSTLGPAAEEARVAGGTIVMRVDRPMAERAVALGRRIAVVAALCATVEPTRALLFDAASRAGRTIEVRDVLCEDAWTHFERGETTRYLHAIEDAIVEHMGAVDVVVLAQASMAPAAERFTASRVPVLASPRLAVEAALDVYRGRRS
jgi:hypothetical protein